MHRGSRAPLRGAIIGFGFIAEQGHLPAWLAAPEQFEIVAVADICATRLRRARKLLPSAALYSGATELLAAEAAGLDFVDIATPPCDHASLTHLALDHGLHVFCEKPIATKASDAASMLAHAAAVRRVLFPSHNYKYAPVIRAIRGLIDEGAIGPIHLVTLDTFRTTHALGVADWEPNWRRLRKISGGGIAMDHGSHTFYLAFDWMTSFASAVSARMTTRSSSMDTEDSFTCTLTFPTGTAQARLTWTSGFRKVIYTLHGSGGAIKVEDDCIEIHRPALGGPASVERRTLASDWADASHAKWFGALYGEFAQSIASEQWAGAEAIAAARAVQLIETAYASARAGGRSLTVDPELRHGSMSTSPWARPDPLGFP